MVAIGDLVLKEKRPVLIFILFPCLVLLCDEWNVHVQNTHVWHFLSYKNVLNIYRGKVIQNKQKKSESCLVSFSCNARIIP